MSQHEAQDGEDSGSQIEPFRFEATEDLIDTIIDPLEACDKEAVFTFGDDGLTANTVGPANVLLADVNAPAGAFESFDGGDLTTGLDLAQFTDFATADDTATVSWNVDDYALDVTSGPVDATLDTIAPDSVETMQPKESVYDSAECSWDMTHDDFRTALSATKKLGGTGQETAEFHIDPDDGTVSLHKIGDGHERVRAEFENAEIDDEPPSRVVSKQNESYLSRVRKAIPSDVEVHCLTADGYPVIFEWSHLGVDVTVLQAPRLGGD